MFLTNVPGLLTDVDDPTTIVAKADNIADIEAAIADGSISGGMVPRCNCPDAVRAGAASAHMLDGRIPHVLLLELFTDAGIGTMITDSHDSSNAGRNMR